MQPNMQPDAPLIALMSLKHNTLLKDMTTEQLTEHLARIRAAATQAVTLKAELTRESEAKKPRKQNSQVKNFLDSL